MATLASLFEPEDYDPNAQEVKRAQHVPVKPKGELKPLDEEYYRNQPARENLSEVARTLGRAVGASPTKANQMGSDVSNWIDFVPAVNDALGATEVTEDLSKGNYGRAALGAGLTALGVVPVVGDVAAKVGREGMETVADTVSAAVKAPTPSAGGKREAITAVNLRELPLADAIASANTGRHIIPKPEGGFVGAPYSARTMEDLDLIRQKFDDDVAAGAVGGDWYERAQNWIKMVAGNDPVRRSELSRNLALFSAQADPGGNLGFSIQARNNAAMGMTPVSAEGKPGVVRTGQQWDTYKQAYDASQAPRGIGDNGGPPLDAEIQLGPKTDIYAGHMDPTRTNPTTGTNDIWHARALGYTTPEGKPWESALTSQQHSWMDAETVAAVDRANKAAIGGRTDWTPGEIQAAPWVAGKGRSLAEEKFYRKQKDVGAVQGPLSPAQLETGYGEAAKTYPDYAPKYLAYGTHEQTPGKVTGHLPGVASGSPEMRQAYADDPRSWWQTPENKDLLYESQNLYTYPTLPMIGRFEGDVNPGQVARPMVSFAGDTGERQLEAASRQALEGTEAFRSVMDAQAAGASSVPIPGSKVGHQKGYSVDLPPEAQTAAGLDTLAASVKGLPDVAHYGGGDALLTQFYPMPERDLFGAKGGQATLDKIRAAIPGAKAQPVGRDGTYFEPDWSQPGSDTVTKEMLKRLNPTQEAALSKSPEVRDSVLAKMDRDIDFAKRSGTPVREDIQNLRRIFGTGGFDAVRKAIGQGLLPAAAGTMALRYASSQEDRT